jgi:hypothetical protein
LSPRPSALVHIRPQVHSPSAAFACDNVLYHTLGEPGRGPVKKRCYPFSHDSRNHRAFAGPPAGAFFHTRENRPLRSLAPRRERIETSHFDSRRWGCFTMNCSKSLRSRPSQIQTLRGSFAFYGSFFGRIAGAFECFASPSVSRVSSLVVSSSGSPLGLSDSPSGTSLFFISLAREPRHP